MGKEKIILGIDPGTNIMGYGILKTNSSKIELISMGIIDLKKFDNHMLKLKTIFTRTLLLIDSYHPDELAIEAPFYGKNVQSMLKLGRAQGTCIAAAVYRDIPVFEYAPKRIKQAITGNGNASKEQVASMLKRLLNIEEAPRYLDATDGMAAAVTHHFTYKPGDESSSNKASSWKAFISQNPDRLKKR